MLGIRGHPDNSGVPRVRRQQSFPVEKDGSAIGPGDLREGDLEGHLAARVDIPKVPSRFRHIDPTMTVRHDTRRIPESQKTIPLISPDVQQFPLAVKDQQTAILGIPHHDPVLSEGGYARPFEGSAGLVLTQDTGQHPYPEFVEGLGMVQMDDDLVKDHRQQDDDGDGHA